MTLYCAPGAGVDVHSHSQSFAATVVKTEGAGFTDLICKASTILGLA